MKNVKLCLLALVSLAFLTSCEVTTNKKVICVKNALFIDNGGGKYSSTGLTTEQAIELCKE